MVVKLVCGRLFFGCAMFKKTSEVVNFADWRWRLLLCLALLLIAAGMAKGYGSGVETTSKVSVTPESWLEMGLRWEPEGRLGQGVYANGDKDARLSAAMVVGEGAGEKSPAEPRLAVFIFRPLDLNRIDFETLRVLKGVGPKMAAAIIAYRQNHGPFLRIEDLLEVKGVGPAKFKVLCRSLAVKASGNSCPSASVFQGSR